jgi:nicotinamide riboside transporter PnuC
MVDVDETGPDYWNELIRIGRTRRQTCVWLAFLGVAGMTVLYPIFSVMQDPLPFWDSDCNCEPCREYMLCIKLLESWKVYFVADVISLVTLAFLGMWVTFGTYLVFTALCVMGVRVWLKRLDVAAA